MTIHGSIRTLSALSALTTAQVALAQTTSEPTFAITASGWWSLLGTAIFVTGLIWVMRKMG